MKSSALKIGSTIALVNVAGAIYEPEKYNTAHRYLQKLGLKVKESPTLRTVYGYLAGTDEMRAEALNWAFDDTEVDAILCMRGGVGCTRILDKIDYDIIRNNPKIFCGFSDVTALHSAIFSETGLITFHGAVATKLHDEYTLNFLRRAWFDTELLLLKNPLQPIDLQEKYPIKTIYSGKATGKLVGGNLALLTSLLGTKYSYDYQGKILFIEEVNEATYRIDRMFSQLRLAGVFERVSGVIVGQFTNCRSKSDRPSQTLEEVLNDYLKPIKKPVFMGAMFGHISQSFPLPVGAMAEMDADSGTIQLLENTIV